MHRALLQTALLLGLALGVPAPSAFAHDAPPDPPAGSVETRHRHLGFFIRPELGFGYMQTSATLEGASSTLSGRAGFAGVAIGGALTENLILSGHIYVGSTMNPRMSSPGGILVQGSDRFTVNGIGPELDYYFMPVNVYVGLTLAYTEQWLTIGRREYRGNDGFGGELVVGKEWWVSDHWGLGVAGKISASSNRDEAGLARTRWIAFGGGVLFSATYN